MSGGIGYVVVEYALSLPADLSSTVLHPDLADACFERDLRVSEAAPGIRFMVCEVAEPQDEDQ